MPRGLKTPERCAICRCRLHRAGEYGRPFAIGRSHATRHHFVPERFFGRSANRPGTTRPPIFEQSPWPVGEGFETFCYDCHEELLHNPVFLPADIKTFAALCVAQGLCEDEKTDAKDGIAGRIRLLHEVIEAGLTTLQSRSNQER